ncbi:hypothetical protein BCS37_03485 [Selenomonas sp. oral taxon 920]|uniref:hypothetical protein n=1 Tax=Selenomonas sp. oral taxon 920 TaxID=1884263 RepID=UPI000840FC85|nr:hypothetical protein [Selenomonas sp. oral taxon 920]AOH47566.1 hypothetical protein BCS37_03485 [Selenomonas sp. oral taxon 920]
MISSKIRFPVIFIGIFVIASLVALYAGTIGRMERADAAESIKLYCDAFVRQDEEAQKQLESYGAPTDSFNMRAAFSNAIQTAGAMLTPEEAAEIGDAYLESLRTATVETAVSEQGNGLATVEVTVTRFNMPAAREKASSLLRQRMNLGGSPEELRRTAVEATAEAYRELEPVGTVTFYVPVRYNEETRIWDPADPMQFGFDLSKQTMGVE